MLILDHNLGGGANKYRARLIDIRRSVGDDVVLGYYDLPALEYRALRFEGEEQQTFRIGKAKDLYQLLKHEHVREVFVNTLYSYPLPLDLARFLAHAGKIGSLELTIAMHDYFPVCPAYSLVDYSGKFCGIPENLDICMSCLAQHTDDWTHLVGSRNIYQWREIWSELFAGATRILCFANSTVELLLRAYPHLDRSKIIVRPHVVDYLEEETVHVSKGNCMHIGIVGEISRHKGAGIVRQMAELIDRSGLNARITVVGTLDDPPNTKTITVQGRYNVQALARAIEQSGANLFLVPSIWPETFSYTTEELMQLGVPVAVFDLGAPAERVRDYPKGLLIDKIDAEFALNRLRQWYESLYGPNDSDRSIASSEAGD